MIRHLNEENASAVCAVYFVFFSTADGNVHSVESEPSQRIYIHIHIHMHTYIFIYTHACIYIYLYIYITFKIVVLKTSYICTTEFNYTMFFIVCKPACKVLS